MCETILNESSLRIFWKVVWLISMKQKIILGIRWLKNASIELRLLKSSRSHCLIGYRANRDSATIFVYVIYLRNFSAWTWMFIQIVIGNMKKVFNNILNGSFGVFWRKYTGFRFNENISLSLDNVWSYVDNFYVYQSCYSSNIQWFEVYSLLHSF